MSDDFDPFTRLKGFKRFFFQLVTEMRKPEKHISANIIVPPSMFPCFTIRINGSTGLNYV